MWSRYAPITVNPHLLQVGQSRGQWVGICSDSLSAQFIRRFVSRVGAFVAGRIFIIFGIPVQNLGDLQHKIVPVGWEFVKQLLQISTNPLAG